MTYDPLHKSSKFKDYFAPSLILLSGIIVSAFIFWSNNAPEKITAGSILPIDSNTERAKISISSGNPILGNPNAKITIIEFADFQCGYCKLFSDQVLPQIIDKYIKTGKAKFISKDFAIKGENSMSAAIAANCANEQNKFIEYHNGLYGLQEKENGFSRDNIMMIAQNLNLNIFKFNSCLGNGDIRKEVEQNTKEGKLAGVTGTPTIFINGIKISGAQGFSVYETIIEQELKSAR